MRGDEGLGHQMNKSEQFSSVHSQMSLWGIGPSSDVVKGVKDNNKCQQSNNKCQQTSHRLSRCVKVIHKLSPSHQSHDMPDGPRAIHTYSVRDFMSNNILFTILSNFV